MSEDTHQLECIERELLDIKREMRILNQRFLMFTQDIKGFMEYVKQNDKDKPEV